MLENLDRLIKEWEPVKRWHGYTLEELERAAGADADLLTSDEEMRDAFAFSLSEMKGKEELPHDRHSG